MIPSVPILETDRLRLRGFEAEDFSLTHALWSDPEVVRFISGKPSGLEESWNRFYRKAGHWRIQGCGYWLVEDKRTGTFFGEAGFSQYYRDIEPSIHDGWEVGWTFATAHQGKGYAQEAMRAVLAWGRQRFPDAPIRCLIKRDNAASLRLADRLGFVFSHSCAYKGADSIVLVLADVGKTE